MERVGCCLVVFLLTLAVSEATRCYFCTTVLHKGCGDDDFDTNSKTIDCPFGKCTKAKTGGLIARTCGSGLVHVGGDDDCKEAGDSAVCVCKGNLCNEATVKVASLITLALCVIINIAFRIM